MRGWSDSPVTGIAVRALPPCIKPPGLVILKLTLGLPRVEKTTVRKALTVATRSQLTSSKSQLSLDTQTLDHKMLGCGFYPPNRLAGPRSPCLAEHA